MKLVLSSRPLLFGLFLLPYLSIAATGFFLFNIILNNVIAGGFGLLLLILWAFYLIGLLGNHSLKVYSFFAILCYMLVFLGFLRYWVFRRGTPASEVSESFGVREVIFLYWLPQIFYVICIVAIPSASEIMPNQVYLGNAAAAVNLPRGITHVLELHDKRRKNHPADVEATLLQLECDDDLGSEHSLQKVSKRAFEFIDQALSQKESRVLVHCSAGVSRSPALVVLWLVESRGMDVAEAENLVWKARPCVDISTDHRKGIREYHSKMK